MGTNLLPIHHRVLVTPIPQVELHSSSQQASWCPEPPSLELQVGAPNPPQAQGPGASASSLPDWFAGPPRGPWEPPGFQLCIGMSELQPPSACGWPHPLTTLERLTCWTISQHTQILPSNSKDRTLATSYRMTSALE